MVGRTARRSSTFGTQRKGKIYKALICFSDNKNRL